jgi:acyl-coenzyme A synthetase/AMP-(fatty) acid ligase
MNMLRNNQRTLSSDLSTAGASGSVFGQAGNLSWIDLLAGTVLPGAEKLDNRSVLVAISSQFAAAAAMIELDGVARRMVLYPPDLSLEHLAFVVDCAGIDLIVSDRLTDPPGGMECVTPWNWSSRPDKFDNSIAHETEWVLLTSGTTGRPKLVAHTLASLVGAIETNRPQSSPVVWSTFYDIRRYGGLQIFLRAAVSGTSLVLSGTQESTADFLLRAGSLGVTHISGTPSHWRRALMSSAAHLITPRYVRLSGEIADQGILNQLRTCYPEASIVHAFATTEAGVAFEVNDGLAGFPADVFEHTLNVEMKIENRSLHIRSDRTARCYLGDPKMTLRDADGFVDTRDAVELRDGRHYFVGRADGMINVGGMKVYPEEVEAVINSHPKVEMSLVRHKKNPITGALVVADVVLKHATETASSDVRDDILRLCRETLLAHKVPATINFVGSLAVAETGKLIRPHA